MKFTIDSKELKRLLDLINFIAKDSFILKNKKSGGDNTVTAILTVKNDKLIMETASEGISYLKISSDAKVEKKGKCIAEISTLSKINLKGQEVTIEEKEDLLYVSCGRLKANINIKSTDNMEDAVPDDKMKTTVLMPIKNIEDAIHKTIFPTIDTEMETTLPFIMATKKGSISFSSLDHFCSSLYNVKKFKGDGDLSEMKCIPSGVLQKIIGVTKDKEVKLGFGAGQFIIKTNDILILYPQPQYQIADINDAVKQLKNLEMQLSFKFNPGDFYDGIDDVNGMGDSIDSKMEVKIKEDKVFFSIEGMTGKAKSFAKVSGIKGKKKEFSVVYNVLYNFAAQAVNVAPEDSWVLSIHNNIIIIETTDESIIYTLPTM